MFSFDGAICLEVASDLASCLLAASWPPAWIAFEPESQPHEEPPSETTPLIGLVTTGSQPQEPPELPLLESEPPWLCSVCCWVWFLLPANDLASELLL